MESSVKKAEIAEILGVSPHTITAFIKDGFPRTGINKGTRYPVAKCVAWYTDHIYQKKIKNASKDSKYKDAKTAMLMKATYEAELKKLEFEERSGKLVDAAQVEKHINALTSQLRDKLMSIPAVWAPFVLGIKKKPEATKILTEQVDKTMTELAKTEIEYE